MHPRRPPWLSIVLPRILARITQCTHVKNWDRKLVEDVEIEPNPRFKYMHAR